MLSEFLCECHGRMMVGTGDSMQEVLETITPGKNDDEWWTAEHLLKQVREKAIRIFNQLHPNGTAVFMFDNSTNHGAYAQDALNINNMTLNSMGKQRKRRNGWFMKDDQGITQEMTFPMTYHDTDLAGGAKGIQLVLQERGLWVDKMVLKDARYILTKQDDLWSKKHARRVGQ